jgi:iron complex transport system ATP-binding protein
LNKTSHILSLQQVSVGYAQPLLQNVSIDFKSPGLIGIIGNNGKGKTTLLKNLSGLQKPLSGKIIFDQKNIFDLSAAERAKIVSFSFASSHISFPISVYELVSMGRYPYNNHWAGLSETDKEIISNAIDLCGIKNLQNKFVTSLSDGERQKTFIAKTIAQQTPVILFDEPTAFLDYASKKYFFQTMKSIAIEQRKIILISSHDIDFLTTYADDLLMIEDDETVLYDQTEKIMRSEYFNTHFTKKNE